MAPRTIAIGDIHGCSMALSALLHGVDPRPGDTLVLLGDYIDRGPDSRGVLDRLIALRGSCRVVPILGNHDQMLLDALQSRSLLRSWLDFGGIATLQSYGGEGLRAIPPEHVAFLRSCRDYFETPTHLYAHASYRPGLPMDRQPVVALRWESLRDGAPGPHVSGKTAVVGHTSQKGGEVLDLGHLKCIDTYCYGGGWLTARDEATGRLWQANAFGELRDGPVAADRSP